MTSEANYWKRNTFMSYVAPPSDQMGSVSSGEWCLPNDMRNLHLCQPRLLAKEQVVAKAPAYLYPAITPIAIDVEDTTPASREAVLGLLSVTNFKLSFVPVPLQRQAPPTQELYQEHLHLQRNDVTLNNIDYIYQLGEDTRANALSGNKRKKLDSHQKIMNGRIVALHIVCKNFRLLKFAFHHSKAGPDHGKQIASALARFVFRSRHDLSFSYCYREPYYSTLAKSAITLYTTKNDWARELIRCGATKWQVVSKESVPRLQQPDEASKYTLPPHFVIPKDMHVDRFLDLSTSFSDSRAPFWVYDYGNASLVRLAELKPTVQQDSKVENIVLETVRKCNENRKLQLIPLTDLLPSIQDVQRAYLKFRRLCTSEEPQKFLMQDAKFLTLLEKTNWLNYVSECLRYSCMAADTLRAGTTCVLQETQGRDLCCVVSSLAQIILDPLFRTIDGFQSLIQKEWIALEHPFLTRLGHVRGATGTEGSESPVFLLFLDCVWQLLEQYPDEFEYSQTYLTTLWDSCFIPIFDTFQFDTQADRMDAVHNNNLVLRPIWDWSEQFAEKDKVFFINPLYQRQRNEQQAHRPIVRPASAIMLPGLAQPQQRFSMNPQYFKTQSTIPKDRYLEPQFTMIHMAIWEQCYYRWMPVLEIKNGGFAAQVDLHHRVLLSSIAKLQRAIELQDFEDLPDVYYEISGEDRPQQWSAESADSDEYLDGVECRRKPSPPLNRDANGICGGSFLPSVSSFFPFSINSDASQQLHNILSNGSELPDGSIID